MKRTALALAFATVAALGVTQPAQAAPTATAQMVVMSGGLRCGVWWFKYGFGFPWWC